MKNISILGSTGSIGIQTLDVIRENKDKFNVTALAVKSNINMLLEQIQEFRPKVVVVYEENEAIKLKNMLQNTQIEVLHGMDGLKYISSMEEVDIVLTALVGMIGLIPTIEAIKSRKTIALANKETLVTGGKLVMSESKKYNSKIIPVDSEHSAIFQCLNGEDIKNVENIILTASGGPFRGKKKNELINVTKSEALKHPNWNMGSKITIDSSTLMNKGLEIIEAKWLFDINVENIKVLVHPQSIIHSMVEFIDGSVIAQLGNPDMKLPIQYALGYPCRISNNFERLNLAKVATLTFEEPDMDTFPCLRLAYEAIHLDGTYPTVLNAANEVLVSEFLRESIGFYDIPKYIEVAMEKHEFIKEPTLEEILQIDEWTRDFVTKSIK
ncbi:1-deoxy-D-xylulose 5-phosphate reductoisomerase [Alkalithermobacter thermoalcaliphilus JW-YL-7 = DSM 7308]|uniref:1-deoxy-D-xylulose 5-phosphate reductoisomerase n=1 Tax=Alkalithermobacter thermoalcaliphilus JW-YL-7 = DSM 7308 TaxID=1121328 RepID=A0A150FQG0_CLOPD|nr:1-deoxy-D-xylulose 5-phosphate reductoisomerase [[Clostridium] paradoxum JW-YL-7 = DSM 7308]SHK59813.1 1-deoxy-D-xylulose 5-phosphate reductoisomerase [[Clostridium] paradoxum JW-YL-7 = DSM 7308]